jgi:hypothetical protein
MDQEISLLPKQIFCHKKIERKNFLTIEVDQHLRLSKELSNKRNSSL